MNEQSGLSGAEARARLGVEGPNELQADEPDGLFRTVLRVLQEPMLLLLLFAGGLYLLIGDLGEALILLSFVLVVIGITSFQERKTGRALAALRQLSSPRALVIRGGERLRIPGREVVRGDMIVISEGDRVPADAKLSLAVSLQVDESMLTGESVPVRKLAAVGDTAQPKPGGDDTPFIFSGTLVVRGWGLALVHATGSRTEMGKIGTALSRVALQRTPLEAEVSRVVRTIALVGLSLCAVLVLAIGLQGGGWIRALLSGIALAMAVLPEELPVVLTVLYALGAWRISKRGVLTRKLSAIEAIGSATVLCTDKTGTLTENRMRVVRLVSQAGVVHEVGEGALPESAHDVLEYGILASQREPFDPMDIALRSLGDRGLAGTEHLHETWTLEREYPLSPSLLAVAQVWCAPNERERIVAAKGAPEAIADLCHLDDASSVMAQVAEMAALGVRVLAVARARFVGESLPSLQHDFAFDLVGLVGLEDPLRPTAARAVAECREAGVRVIMITGDHPATARAIGARIGLDRELVVGAELDAMDDEALRARLGSVSIVARAVPEQKLRIVKALAASGEVVAMTGDGVNDAPALKAAHIGVAMGARGTDVAREAAGLVVTDDDFASIVGAIRLGRRIRDNLEKAMAYVVAVHVPIAGLALIPALVGWPSVLFPAHIVVMELVIDPACSIAFESEPEEDDVMARPPRGHDQRLFALHRVVVSAVAGLSVLGASLATFAWGLHRGEDVARSLAFMTMLVGNVALIQSHRSRTLSIVATLRRPNLISWLLVVFVGVFLALIQLVPSVGKLFHLGAVLPSDVLVATLSGMACIAWMELVKLVGRARRRPV